MDIFEMDRAVLHAKVLLVDGNWTMVGSANMDLRSFHRNYELNVLVGDPRTGRSMRGMFAADLMHAARVLPDEWKKRPFRARAAEAVASLFSFNL